MSDAQQRVERARQLLEGLKKEVDVFFQTKPYEIISEEEGNGDLVVKVKVNSEVPEHWKITIGEIIHHLRASLDLFIHDLVTANGGTPTRDTSFPIFDSEQDFNTESTIRLSGVASNFVASITALKPYRGGNDDLWKLHKLDIEDKHHKLIVAGSAHRSVIIDFAQGLRDLKPEMELPSMPISLFPADRDFPLFTGSVLYKELAQARTSQPRELPKFDFEIAYGDNQIVVGEPLIPSLESFTKTVEAIV